MEGYIDAALGFVGNALTVDLPEILELCGSALRKAPFKTTAAKWMDATVDEYLALAPFIGFILVLASTLLLVSIAGNSSTQHPAQQMKGGGGIVAGRLPPDVEGSRAKESYWLTRIVLLRGMGLVYLAAFLTSAAQSRALFGTLGLSPSAALTDPTARRRPTPAFDWMEHQLGVEGGDLALELLSWMGVLLSALLAFGDRLVGLWAGLPLVLWAMYLSLINLEARVIIGYGWEWETVEIGFLMIFLCPSWPSAFTQFPRGFPPPTAVIWLLRWATFRLLLGAGMSKLGERSSECWKELSCTETHYYTQPMPNFVAWFFHRLPADFHRAEIALTFVEQLLLPFAVLIPFREVRITACLAELFFQLCIVGTGNYAWINWIGALPCLSLLDDAFLTWVGIFSAEAAAEASAADLNLEEPVGSSEHEPAASADIFHENAANAAAVATARELESSSALSEQHQHQQQGKRVVTNGKGPDSGALPGPSLSGWRHALRVCYRAFRSTVHLGLAIFIFGKSTAPLKELFGKAPWLSYYDDYFFVNAQGVFGFINQHRVTLVLHYTHDPLPEMDADLKATIAACTDPEGIVVHDGSGQGYTCVQVASYCSSNPQLATTCPKTCGGCPARHWTDSAMAGISWKPLHFKNLPGHPTRMPTINSPYHYRLDWETWIQTTASMEHHMKPWLSNGKKIMPASRMPVPQIHSTLISKLLAGDTDAAGLMGTPPDELMAVLEANNKTLAPPTAIRAEFYSYTFSNWDALVGRNEWWSREQMSMPIVFETDGDVDGRNRGTNRGFSMTAGPRRSPWQRYWLLLTTTAGFCISFSTFGDIVFSQTGPAGTASRSVSGLVAVLFPLVMASMFALCFCTVLMKDYPTSTALQQHRWILQMCSMLKGHGQYHDVVGLAGSYLAMAVASGFIFPSAAKMLLFNKRATAKVCICNALALSVMILAMAADELQAMLLL